MRLQCCIVFISCLLYVAAAKHIGGQGYEQKYGFLQNKRDNTQQDDYRGGYQSEYHGNENLPQVNQQQKFLLDVLLQVQKPVVNTEIIKLGEYLITEPSYYTQPRDEELVQFLDQCKSGQVLGSNEVYTHVNTQDSHQLIGLYRFLVLARDWQTFQRNVAFARINVNPVLFVNALQMAVRDRHDTRNLVFPPLCEVLPELFFSKNIIENVRNFDYSILSNGISSFKPTIFNLLGIGQFLPSSFGGLDWDVQSYHVSQSKIVLPVQQDEQKYSYLTDDIELNVFWNNIINERLLQTVSGCRKQFLQEYQDQFFKSIGYNNQQYSPYNNQYQYRQNQRDNVNNPNYYQDGRFVRSNDQEQTAYNFQNILGKRFRDFNNENLPESSIFSDRLLHVSRRRTQEQNQQLDQQQYYQPGQWTRYGHQQQYGPQQQYEFEENYGKKQYYQPGQWTKYGHQQQYEHQQQYGRQQQYGPQQQYGLEESYGKQQYEPNYYQGYESRHRFGQNIENGRHVEQYQTRNDKNDYFYNLFKGHQQSQKEDRKHQDYYQQGQDQIYDEQQQFENYYGKQHYQQKENQFPYVSYGKQYYQQQKESQRPFENYFGKQHYQQEENQRPYGKYYGKQYYQQQEDSQGPYEHYYGTQYYKQQEDRQYPFGKYHGKHYDQVEEQQQYGKYFGKYDKEGQDYYRYEPFTPIVEGDRLVQRRHEEQGGIYNGRNVKYGQYQTLSPTKKLMAVRSGEIFVQNLQQLIARIYFEKVALKLDNIQTQEENQLRFYQFGANSPSIGEQYNQKHIQNSQLVYQSIEKGIQELRNVINNELRRRQINENSEQVLYVLGDILMDYSEQIGGNIWDQLYNTITREIYGQSNFQYGQTTAYEYYENTAKYMTKPSLNLKDPIYIDIVYQLVQLINEYQKKVQSYGVEQLRFNGVAIQDVQVDKLITYTEKHDCDLINLVGEPLSLEKLKNVQTKVVARQERLNHLPFTVSYVLKTQQPQRVVVRTLLAPKYNADGQLVTLQGDRNKFIVLDAFVQELTAGDNIIERRSYEMSRFAGRTVSTLSQIYKRVMHGQSFDELVSDQGRFPHRLLLPRGSNRGLPVQFLVVITPVDDALYQQDYDYRQIFGLGISTLNYDRLPLNYPLDRYFQISDEEFLQFPNTYLKDVEIVHKY